MADIRNQKLMSLAQMSINGQVTHKLDQIASVYINEQPYFNVFRRYNSPYNIVIEDYTGDIYLRKDKTVRKSLKSILCLHSDEINNMYTIAATSFKHNGPVPYDADMIPDMRWTEVQGEYQAITVTFGGILDDNLQEYRGQAHIPDLLSYYGQNISTQTNPSSSRKRAAEDSVDELYARRYTVDNVDDESIEDEEAESKKCRLIRRSNGTWRRECDEEQEESDEQEEEEEEEEQEEEEEEQEEEEEEEEQEEQEEEEQEEEEEEEEEEQEEEEEEEEQEEEEQEEEEEEEEQEEEEEEQEESDEESVKQEEEEEPRIHNGKRSWCDNEESEESEEQDDAKYVVLRNGHKIRKTSK